jgi:hypothetical protein
MSFLPAAISAVLGLGSMISQNDQNKAANANNLNQQAVQQANAQKAYTQAKNDLAGYTAANPPPVQGVMPGRAKPIVGNPNSGTGAFTPQPVNAASLLGRTAASGGGAAQPQGQQVNPQILQLIRQALANVAQQRQAQPAMRATA